MITVVLRSVAAAAAARWVHLTCTCGYCRSTTLGSLNARSQSKTAWAAPSRHAALHRATPRASTILPFAARLNHSETLINYASRHNPRPKRLLHCLNYSFERFDGLENCRDTQDGLIQKATLPYTMSFRRNVTTC
ncbi:hypothetical protein SFRURICE_020800 [Spodoptera frugiperda]|nr:hypothetical protein SFRURICE_020800 [Spodoptera frugiperda]